MTSARLPLSAFIICKDEAATIGPCLESVKDFAEIVVVDSGSSDGTVQLLEGYAAKGYPVRIFRRDWPGYAKQKQFALEQCTQPWCLSLDADERVDAALLAALPSLTAADATVDAWRLNFRMHLYAYGYTPDGVRFTRAVRLVRNGRVFFDPEQLVHEGVTVDGRIGEARQGCILHARSLPIAEQVLKENRYSSLKAEQMFRKGRKASWARLVFNPPLYFYRIFFRRRLFRCGKAGFVQAATGSLYSLLTEAKLHQLHAAKRFHDPSAAD